MKKREMIKELEQKLKEKGMCCIDDESGKVGWNASKACIQSAIDCLNATDEEMRDYLIVVKIKYQNIYKKIAENGNWMTDSFLRYFVYTTAKMALAD